LSQKLLGTSAQNWGEVAPDFGSRFGGQKPMHGTPLLRKIVAVGLYAVASTSHCRPMPDLVSAR